MPRRDPIARSERIDRLMERIESRGPISGNWGWYRPATEPDVRFAAQVHRTYRDAESSLIDLVIPTQSATPGGVVTGVHPEQFFVDPMARP